MNLLLEFLQILLSFGMSSLFVQMFSIIMFQSIQVTNMHFTDKQVCKQQELYNYTDVKCTKQMPQPFHFNFREKYCDAN